MKVVLNDACSGHLFALKMPLIAAPHEANVVVGFWLTNCSRASSVVKSSFLCCCFVSAIRSDSDLSLMSRPRNCRKFLVAEIALRLVDVLMKPLFRLLLATVVRYFLSAGSEATVFCRWRKFFHLSPPLFLGLNRR